MTPLDLWQLGIAQAEPSAAIGGAILRGEGTIGPMVSALPTFHGVKGMSQC